MKKDIFLNVMIPKENCFWDIEISVKVSKRAKKYSRDIEHYNTYDYKQLFRTSKENWKKLVF